MSFAMFQYRVWVIMCTLQYVFCDDAGLKPSKRFLGFKEDTAVPSTPRRSTADQTHMMSSHLWSLKGLTAPTGSGKILFADEGLFDHANLFNLSLLMMLLFMAVISTIAGTAGLIIFVGSSKLVGTNSVIASESNPPTACLESCDTTHPGCIRILPCDMKENTSRYHPTTTIVCVRE